MTSVARLADQRAALWRGRAVPRWLTGLAWPLTGLALANELYLLFGWLNAPMLEVHGFLQGRTVLAENGACRLLSADRPR